MRMYKHNGDTRLKNRILAALLGQKNVYLERKIAYLALKSVYLRGKTRGWPGVIAVNLINAMLSGYQSVFFRRFLPQHFKLDSNTLKYYIR